MINSIRFARTLRRKNFDLALILHPTIRVHIILFFSRIKERIGYDKKCGFLIKDNENEIIKIVSSLKLENIKKMKEDCIKQAKKFDINIFILNLKNEIKELVNVKK